jgi:lipopolysaccharide transport system permease protein
MQNQTIIIKPRKNLLQIDWQGLWEYRELLTFLVWQQISVRYRQTFVGYGWALIYPIVTIFIYTLVFGRILGVPSDGAAYPVFAFAGVLPWRYFSTALSAGTGSLVSYTHIISKVYFPRVILVITTSFTPLVDFGIAFVMLLGLMVLTGTPLTLRLLAILPLTAFLWLIVLTGSLWLSALNVRLRDVGFALGFAMQFLMYLSPVIYPSSLVPNEFRSLYFLNPVSSVIEGFRWAVLGSTPPDLGLLVINILTICVMLFAGFVMFNHVERTMVDVV